MNILFFLLASIASCATAEDPELLHSYERVLLMREYASSAQTPSDINQHLPHLRRIAKECESVLEIGLRTMVSTRGILLGLAEGFGENPRYTGIDLERPPEGIFDLLSFLAKKNGIHFDFIQKDDLTISEIDPVDLLFIDSLHTYAHLTYELETFSPYVNKYIAMHDTADPFAFHDCGSYHGDRSEYPAFIDRDKRGTWAAVWDFLIKHPEWKLEECYFNSFGFTVLKRIAVN